MWSNLVLSFSAGIIVGLNLIESSQQHQAQEREHIRSLVTEAMQTLQYISAVHKNVGSRMELILLVLLKEEEDIWSGRLSLWNDPSRSLLKARIVSRVQQETEAASAFRHPFTITPAALQPLAGTPFTHPIGVNGVQIPASSSFLPNSAPDAAWFSGYTTSSSNDQLLQVPNDGSQLTETSDLYGKWISKELLLAARESISSLPLSLSLESITRTRESTY